MSRIIVVIGTFCAISAIGVTGQCTDKSQCQTGYYCNVDVNECQACIVCKHYHRQNSTSPLAVALGDCPVSVTQCGACESGYSDDPSGSLVCVEAAESGAAWRVAAVVISAVLAALFLVALVCWLWCDKNKIKSIINMSASCSSRREAPAPAPMPGQFGAPPPYDGPPAAHATSYTVPYTAPSAPLNLPFDEETLLPAKRAAEEEAGAGRGARLGDSAQRAVPSNPPAYVRLPPDIVNSYSPASSPAPPPAADYDENTMESVWTPHAAADARDALDASESRSPPAPLPSFSAPAESVSGEGSGARGSAAGRLAAPPPPVATAAPPTLALPDSSPPPPKLICIRPESGDRRDRGDSALATIVAQSTVIVQIQNPDAL